MAFKVEYKQLSEVALITSGKRPSIVFKEKTKTYQVPVIGSGGKSGFTKNSLYSENILITGRVGTLGKLFSVQEPCWPSDNSLVIRPKGNINFIFLKHVLGSIISSAVGMNRGAANPLITQTDLGCLKISVPPQAVQLQVASLLEKFDDKIECNRRINQTLESISQALFKSWFVDFEGMLRKDLQESELGLVPKGWQIRRVDDLLELAYGKALKSTDRKKGTVPVYGSGGITGYHSEALVPHGSIVVGRKGTIGSLYWVDEPFFPIDTTYYIKSKNAPISYCYYAMKSLGLNQMNTDAAVPGLNRENVYRLKLAVPELSILEDFDKKVSVLRKAIRANSLANKTLATLRDTLLPKLLSGELSVKNLNKEER